ncbi:LIRP-like [Oppia nitens]|uniref:LIRP-like n=1 Tax=Oppia nitens TaxID=1686743 RepID=UPI0023D9D3B2|nr:LIRP-like [Oppia nitens]
MFKHVIKTRSAKQKYCGKNIVNILSMLCDGNYFSPSKRNQLNNHDSNHKTLIENLNNGISSIWDDMNTTDNDEDYKSDTADDVILDNRYFLSKKSALDMFGSNGGTIDNGFNRNRRGIVDECCRKACSIMELISYCE